MPLTTERRRAFLALGTVLATLVALVVPLVGYAVAQAQPNVVIVNPSDYSDDGASQTPLVVSDVPTGDDESEDINETTYRLNAWASNAPTEALLEFELQAGTQTTTLGTADRVADDTFEFNWDITVPDGSYTIRAILYEGSGIFAEEIDRHERPILVRRGSPFADTSSPTVDILHPENGGPGGFYVNPLTGDTNILIDYEISDDTDAVFFFYTLSDPGDDPVWKECASAGGGGAESGLRVRCNLESIDQGGGSVTGVAAVANDDDSGGEDPTFHGSGDAVRLLPYLQDPTSMSIDRETARVDSNPANGSFACSPTQSVTVTDQNSRPIGGINVDVHAAGPSDQTKFWAGSPPFMSAPPPMRSAPDKAHGNEGAYACPLPDRSSEFGGRQGDHNRVGVPDVKHVENTGTGDTGMTGAALHGDTQGETFLTFWADEDNDDLYCSAELAIPASIGWDVPAPAPQLETADLDICPVPSPPPPGQTGSPTGTASPSPTGSPSPDPRGCTIQGTEGDDRLTGTADDDVICGLGGDDDIRGLAGNDVIHGDAGDDVIRSGAGNDTSDGGSGNDGVAGDAGDDVLDGGGGSDIVVGGSGDDTIRGNADGDNMFGQQGRDILQGGSGNDEGTGGQGDDVLKGGAGKDELDGNGRADTIRGGPQNDTLNGGRGPDTIRGGPGRDRCRGGPGRDRVGGCER